MKCVAFAGQKGGSGKSTLSVTLATELHGRGLRVALVDLDNQGTSRDFGRAAKSAGESCPHVMALGPDFDEVLRNLTGYDIAVLDCPGRETSLARKVMMVADAVLVPVQPSPADLWATAETFSTARKAMGIRNDLVVRSVVSRADARRRFSKEVLETLTAAGIPPLATVLHDRADFPASMAVGQSVTTFAPDGKAAIEARALALEVSNLANLQLPPNEVSHVA